MFDKTLVLSVFVFTSILFTTTDCLFVSVGVYPNHTKYGLNTEYCGLGVAPSYVNFTRSSKCFKTNSGDINITFIPSKSRQEVDVFSNRIYNGRDAMVGESPWTVKVVVRIYDNWEERLKWNNCSGSIITFKWILTAAHCVESYLHLRYVRVIAGSRNWINSVNLDNGIFVHQGWYDVIVQEKDKHDFALLKLENPFERRIVGDYHLLNTICLPNEDAFNEDYENATMAGWGVTYGTPYRADRLQLAETVIRPDYNATNATNKCDEQHIICANHNNTEPRICWGDSGGPLYKFSDEEIPRAIQIGVLSRGGGCGEGEGWSKWGQPYHVMQWILDTIENN